MITIISKTRNIFQERWLVQAAAQEDGMKAI
jgi:hypothetical protein